MNCGICVKGNCYNDYEKDFYGMLVDILELEYFGANNKVVLFKCDWYDTEKGVRVHPRHGLVEINYKSRLHPNDPFVLAQQAQQVYYTRYPSKKKAEVIGGQYAKQKQGADMIYLLLKTMMTAFLPPSMSFIRRMNLQWCNLLIQPMI